MTYEEAARILDPETTREALWEIEYYGGFKGREARIKACEEACRIAAEVLREKSKGGITMDAVKFLNELRIMCDSSGGCCNGCPLHIDEICMNGTPSFYMDDVERMVDHVENWAKSHPVLRLTEQQETAIRGRIAEGYWWVARDYEKTSVFFYSDEPIKDKVRNVFFRINGKYDETINSLYDFVTFENSPLYLPELFCEEE